MVFAMFAVYKFWMKKAYTYKKNGILKREVLADFWCDERRLDAAVAP
jgi:hypothetical protein